MSDFDKYNHKELPKIRNPFLYSYRCFMKLVCYVYFGMGAVALALFVFPWIALFVRNKERFPVVARRFVSRSFRHFIGFMRVTRSSKMVVADKDAFTNLHRKILIANHPSILDFVHIMALVPNATCIVRGNLTHTVLRGVIKKCYIVNTLDFDELCNLCREAIEKGSCVIIFPEGTRTPRHGENTFKKGAARIALACHADVQPILIGGNDKYGLGKHDPFWSYNHEEEYLYDVQLLKPILIAEYLEKSSTLAPKHLTDAMRSSLLTARKSNARRYKTNKPEDNGGTEGEEGGENEVNGANGANETTEQTE